MFEGKTVLLGVTGGIATYKAAQLASDLTKSGAQVHVIMTKNATEFVSPLTFETLTNNRVLTDTFDRNFQWNVQHVALAKKADAAIVAPATANMIAKLACGLADDMLSTTLLACRCPKIIAPAMNTGMYENPATQRNLTTLRELGMTVLEPENGLLACGDVGKGRLPELPVLFDAVQYALSPKDMQDIRVLVTAGPTQEAMDPVRFISNHSTGKMGYALAKAARMRGAQVTLVSGKVELAPVIGVQMVPVVSAQEMFDQVVKRAPQQQIIIKCAAVADYRPAEQWEHKMKKSQEDMALPLTRTKDILSYIGHHREKNQIICGFSMETRDLVENSKAKLHSKNVDMIVANNLLEQGAGFGHDTNQVTILTLQGAERLALMSKEDVAQNILNRLLEMYQGK
ncbi:bifunctional phosphopantothenoylcysteine decarboxylase/phosphopantothenate--cysteine ligase CoaBC [Youxingia wuxianensis]|uniref:Coenzyme A biosynthesis bifunctional protein CoaBC n=1 Tax=Youxingia wuxianensis TaxID=2763678 RepID=A0A926EQT7_9FIRM|nr:bifunctional phosphopantothenoylcysteine decarboxylase/phosphopantothenate--cysteine ligase CoaBC [Youxingia wuxianensis]MBC8585722.1 bifunctional phosphopantothenoylcysteine decarboxylase/phosphopantothenate--cysteine ligase CoaBC [Youxingia wuxianensis]